MTDKPDLTCFIDQFPLAMAAIAACHDYERGALDKKDYRASLMRHLFAGELAATAWNAIAQLEISLRRTALLSAEELRQDATNSYFAGMRAIGDAVKAGERELPAMFVSRDRG